MAPEQIQRHDPPDRVVPRGIRRNRSKQLAFASLLLAVGIVVGLNLVWGDPLAKRICSGAVGCLIVVGAVMWMRSALRIPHRFRTGELVPVVVLYESMRGFAQLAFEVSPELAVARPFEGSLNLRYEWQGNTYSAMASLYSKQTIAAVDCDGTVSAAALIDPDSEPVSDSDSDSDSETETETGRSPTPRFVGGRI